MPLDTELHKSAHKGDLQVVRDLVLSGEIHVNAKGAQDRTALHRAVGANHVEIIEFLLEAGAPVDCVDRRLRTPLHWAAISGNIDATQLLLANGGDLRRMTMSGMNPLMCAVQQGWHAVAETILEWSASFAEDGADGQEVPTPEELCCMTDTEGKTVTAIAKETKDVPMQKLLKVYAPRAPPIMACCGFRNSRTSTLQQQQQQQASAAAGAETEAGKKSGGIEEPPDARVSEGRERRGQDEEAEEYVNVDGGGERKGWCRWLCFLASFISRHRASPQQDREEKSLGRLGSTTKRSLCPPTSFGDGDGDGDGDSIGRARENEGHGSIGFGSGSSEADEAANADQEGGAGVVQFSLDDSNSNSNSSYRVGLEGTRLSFSPAPARRISPAPVNLGLAPTVAMADAARGSHVLTGSDKASLRATSGGGADSGGVREPRSRSRASAGAWRGFTNVNEGFIADGDVFEDEDGNKPRQRRAAEIRSEEVSENMVMATSERRSRGSRSVGRVCPGFWRTSKEVEGSLCTVDDEIRKSATEFVQGQSMSTPRRHRPSQSEPCLPRIPRHDTSD